MNMQAEEFDEWADCLLSIAQKDKQALHKFYLHFAPKIKAFAHGQGAPMDISVFVEELVQDVMVKIWNKADTFDPTKSKVSTWLFTIARNCRIDLLRKKTNQPLIVVAEDVWSEEIEEGPLHDLQVKRTQQMMQEKLKELSFDQMTVISKAYFEGLSHGQIAEDLNIPVGTVKSRIRLALNKLQVLFDR